MDRRAFLSGASGAMMYSLIAPSLFAASGAKIDERESINARELHTYLRSLYHVEEPSVDRIIIGDPERQTSVIGTAWMPYWKTLRAAADHGVNILIVHEPTFYTHWDLQAEDSDYLRAPEYARQKYLEVVEEKKQWILDHEITIIRCHDVMDAVKDIGIPYGFAKALGFTNDDIVRSKLYYHVYGVEEQTAEQAARYIAAQLKELGQDGIAFYGDPAYPVRSIGIGTGTISNPLNYMELEPDLFITTDDAIRTWVQSYYATDTGHPLVIVNHGTAEDTGAELFNRHLQDTFPNLDFIHFQQGCGYEWITA